MVTSYSMNNVPEYKFTKEGYQKLKDEFSELTASRPEAVVKLTQMREMGDLSENAGYHAAKDKLRQIDRRLRELKVLIRFGHVVESTQVNVVEFGNTVSIEDDGKNRLEFMIVEGLEADPAKGKISVQSPIGNALLGKKIGDKVEIGMEEKKTYKVISIKS